MPVKPRRALRRCVGCGRHCEQDALMRIACKEGREPVIPDAPLAPGRGAYLCRTSSCLQRALQKRGMERALRFRGVLSTETIKEIADKVADATKVQQEQPL